MALNLRKFLDKYFSREDLQDALESISEPYSASKNELISRLIENWISYRRKWSDILDYADDDAIEDICDDYGLDSIGDRDLLIRRIKRAGILDKEKSSTITSFTKAKSEQSVERTPNINFNIGSVHISKGNKISIGLIAAVITLVIGMWWTSYVANEQNNSQIIQGENIFIGNNVITLPDATKGELSDPNLQNENKVNLFIRDKDLPITETGIHRKMLEFGTQTTPKGADIRIIFDKKYIQLRESFAKPFQDSFPIEGEVFIKTGNTKIESPLFETKFSHPQITPIQSYYVYFESLEPLGYVEGYFDEYRP